VTRIAAVTGGCDPRRLELGRLRTGTHAQLHGAIASVANAGHEVVVHGPDRGGEDPAAAPAGDGSLEVDPVPTGDVDVEDARDPRAVAAGIDRFAVGLAERWRSARPELVHAFDWFAGAAAARALRLVREELGHVPLVLTLPDLGHVHRRHLGETPASAPIRLAVERDLARTADLLIATSVDQHRELLQLGSARDRTVTVSPGVDGARFSPPRAQRPQPTTSVVTVSDLAAHRGTESVIAAVARLPETELTIVGGPPAARLTADPRVAELRALAARHDALDRIRFVGRVPNEEMPALLGAADVVVQVPWFTGGGRAAIEALACGRPVVATAVGSHLDSIEHGVNGVLVPARDPHSLYEALRKLVREPRVRLTLASAARPRTLDRFGWPRATEATLEAYERVLARNAAIDLTDPAAPDDPASGERVAEVAS
jgi:D-inositol-3-phosphate glycosyltransferase